MERYDSTQSNSRKFLEAQSSTFDAYMHTHAHTHARTHTHTLLPNSVKLKDEIRQTTKLPKTRNHSPASGAEITVQRLQHGTNFSGAAASGTVLVISHKVVQVLPSALSCTRLCAR